MKKKRLDEQRAEAALREHIPRPHLYLVLDNIRSLHNVGAIFRAADGFGVRKIFLAGITPCPPRPEIEKVSLGAERSVEYEWMEDPARAVLLLREMGAEVVAAEQADTSVPIYDHAFRHPLGIVLGHEQIGVDGKVLSLCHALIEIPMFGAKHSHNVGTATGVILSEVRRQWRARDESV